MSYTLEKKSSKTPERFGKGAIEGVAGPESANNAASGGAMIPLLVLGIPSSATTAVLMGAFIMYNVQPGPLLFEKYPTVVWGVIASMFVGNLMLLILNMPLIKGFSVMGVRAGEYGRQFPERGRENQKAIWKLAAEGVVRPRVDQEFPLDRWREAFDTLAARKVVGKTIISPDL